MKRMKNYAMLSWMACMIAGALPAEAKGQTASFPESYEAEKGAVTFACQVEVPEDFQADHFYKTDVKAVLLDEEAAVRLLAGDRKIEQADTISGDMKQTIYRFSDGSILMMGNGLSFMTGFWSWYSKLDIWGTSEEMPAAAAAADGSEYVQQVRDMMCGMGFSEDTFVYEKAYYDNGILQERQESMLKSGLLQENKKRDDIGSADSVWLIRGRQYDQGLPVFNEMMITDDRNAMDDTLSIPVRVGITGRGIEQFSVMYLYSFTHTSELLEFAPFEEVVEKAAFPYDMLLTDLTYSFTKATLLERVSLNRDRTRSIGPVWRFIGEDSEGNAIVCLIDAVTGKEIPLE